MTGLIAALIAALAGLTFWMVQDVQRVDRVNHKFTVHCEKLGGHAIITDKDLCVRAGLIVAHEG